ncbi:glyoxylase-like metal-dependent hydrolase (beta-lactamase superfamily II) [Inquilinus ginsengisoli]|uniref:Glyoxylase-like metal-dependent hydrolase (Beta-lactamase superfamily II) n=1 Tax=Inquilinus ginsengisoli TaxID=363840 RepID=A0ABU1JKX8_9PROT|nr:MBL fold metallo-hydrolase [Inquilinus ginsengisoli]MDR6288998.1 glyoxylase-like metal-dependent hydrolase (beta-lactamase superfamily II) [Inquilinus ginsengisoli]
MAPKLIAPGLYAIPVGAVNTFLLDSCRGCTLIDTGFPGSADRILRAMRQIGKQPSDLRHIVLTHAHPDHIGSLAVLKGATGAVAYMHPLDAPIAIAGTGFRAVHAAPGRLTGLMFRLFVRPVDAIAPATVEHQVRDGETLPIAGGLTAIHVPGHCAGQLAFLWPQHGGVLFAADACSNLPGLGLSLGYEDLEEGRRSLGRLAALDFQIACFGHGGAILQDASARFRRKWGSGP